MAGLFFILSQNEGIILFWSVVGALDLFYA